MVEARSNSIQEEIDDLIDHLPEDWKKTIMEHVLTARVKPCREAS
jgi:hypothetical protein